MFAHYLRMLGADSVLEQQNLVLNLMLLLLQMRDIVGQNIKKPAAAARDDIRLLHGGKAVAHEQRFEVVLQMQLRIDQIRAQLLAV